MRRLGVAIMVLAFGWIFAGLIGGYAEREMLRPLAEYYVTRVPADLGAPNIVTGILISYRGFDTLGEVAVLFMAAISIGVLLKAQAGGHDKPRQPASEIVITGMQVLLPLIFCFGIYVIGNGHLSAGGGFQGGAIVASGTMLLLLAKPSAVLNLTALSVGESLFGIFYVLLGIAGVVLAGGFLDPRFLPPGEFGTLFSAGAIPLISVLLGLKVGAELSVILDRFRS